jgi:hypothetical protein
VSVTLQQLDTMLHGRLPAFAPGMEFKPDTAAIEACEADLVILASSARHTRKPLELVIAECKDASGEIADEDVRKLSKVAEALSEGPFEVFIPSRNAAYSPTRKSSAVRTPGRSSSSIKGWSTT